MLKRLMFVSRTAAENMPGWESGAIISITEPDAGQAKLMQGWYVIHRAMFHDIDAPRPGESHTLMSAQHAAEIVDFVHSVSPHIKTIVVHCKGGISRSAAVAKWIAEAYNLPFNHTYGLYNMHVYRQLIEANERRKRRPQ